MPAALLRSAWHLCRKDMLDEALLRPGRLEVQVEIGLADEKGRHQILKVWQPNLLQLASIFQSCRL